MKRIEPYALLIGLTLGTAFFSYCAVIVVTKLVAAPRAGHYFGAFLVPGMFLAYLILVMTDFWRQRWCKDATSN